MDNEGFKIKKELKLLSGAIKTLDKKVIVIFLSAIILQTFSYYYTSRLFFEQNLSGFFADSSHINLLKYVYWYLGDFFTLFILPYFIIKFILREKIKDYGITRGDFSTGIRLSFLFIIIMLPFIWFASAGQNFILTYPLLDTARESWNVFFLYEIGLVVFLFAWEFIWRGFMLFGLKDKFGYYAVIIQMIPFVILHDGKPAAETFGAIIGGLALGILAYRTKSIYYCVIAHAGVMFSIDFISTLRYRAGDFGVGFSSLFHIIRQIF
jgi:CAAX protease family protein